MNKTIHYKRSCWLWSNYSPILIVGQLIVFVLT